MFLSRFDKSLNVPPIVISNAFPNIGGGYYHPEPREILLGDRYHDISKGLILVTEHDSENIESTIHHEWRHHWQFFNIGKP